MKNKLDKYKGFILDISGTQLIETDNKELVNSMLNTIKEFENENEKNKRIEEFNQFIK